MAANDAAILYSKICAHRDEIRHSMAKHKAYSNELSENHRTTSKSTTITNHFRCLCVLRRTQSERYDKRLVGNPAR